MGMRTRKLIGTVVMLAFIFFYALFAMAVAEGRISEAPKLIQTLAYIVLGLIFRCAGHGKSRMVLLRSTRQQNPGSPMGQRKGPLGGGPSRVCQWHTLRERCSQPQPGTHSR